MATSNESRQIGQYQLGELIGRGAIGEVYKALDTETAGTVAIKQIDLYSISAESIRSIESEINLLKKLDHPNIVKYIECIQTKTHINIVLEYVETGSLYHILQQSGKIGEHLVFIFVKQILEGLVYLHNQGIIHRDIKGANLLLTKTGIIKLADFGYSILNDKNKVHSLVGTCCWMAPEVIEQKGIISPKCDIWSLGSTIIQLLTTKPPYYEFEAYCAMFRIVKDECPPLPTGISDLLKDFLLRCLVKDPEKRASAKELLSHQWITTPNKKLVKKFIYENDNSAIPLSLINEWKNNYRDNLSSITSSQNEKERSKSKSNSIIEIKDDDNITIIPKISTINNTNKHLINNDKEGTYDIEKIICPNKSKEMKKRKDLSSPKKQNYTRQNKLIEHGRNESKKNNSASNNDDDNIEVNNCNKHLASPDSKGKHHHYQDLQNENKQLQYSNLSLKNLNAPNINTFNYKKQNDIHGNNNINNKQMKLNQSNDNNINNIPNDNLKNICFNEAKLNLNNEEGDNNEFNTNNCKDYNTNNNTNTENKHCFNKEINFLLETLSQFKNENISKLIEDPKLSRCLQMKSTQGQNTYNSLRKSITSPNDDYGELNELKAIIQEIDSILIDKKLNELDLLINLIKLNQILKSKSNLINDYLVNNSIVELINLFNYKNINSKIVYIILSILNQIIIKEPTIIESMIICQLFFYLSRLIHFFNDIEIKIELMFLINQCLLNVSTTKLFLSSGGLYILTSMIDPMFIKSNDIILILSIDYLLMIIDNLSQDKSDDICLLFLHNKILARLNLILIDLFNEDNELDINSNIIVERILNLLLKFTSMKRYMYQICNDKIMKTLIHLSSSININHIIRLLTIFDQIIIDSDNLNKLENLGYIDSLIKLLNIYAYHDADEKNLIIKIIQKTIIQINHLLKLNRSRCDLFVINDGIDIICSLAGNSSYTDNIISIFNELINSSQFAREKLKQSKTMELIMQLLKNKSNKLLYNDLIQLVIDWLSHDKGFVEEIISQEINFASLFGNMINNDSFKDNLNECLSKLNDFLRSSEIIEMKFFEDKKLVKNVIEVLNGITGYIHQKDVHLLNKVMDYYEFLIKNKYNDEGFLAEINFNRTIDKIKSISKEKHLIIIDEKIKKIGSYLKD